MADKHKVEIALKYLADAEHAVGQAFLELGEDMAAQDLVRDVDIEVGEAIDSLKDYLKDTFPPA